MDEEDEDALMQRALEMSMREMLTVNTPPSATGGAESKSAADAEEDVSKLRLWATCCVFAVIFGCVLVLVSTTLHLCPSHGCV